MPAPARANTVRRAFSNPMVPLAIVGYSLFVAANSFNLREPSTLFASIYAIPEIWTRVLTYLPFALVSVLLGIVVLKATNALLKWLPLASAALFVASLAVFCMGALCYPSFEVAATSMVLLGCYSALTFASWIRCVMHLSRDQLWLFIIISSILATFVHFASMVVCEAVPTAVVFVALSLCSLGILFSKKLLLPEENGRIGVLDKEKSKLTCLLNNQGVVLIALGALGFVSSSSRIILHDPPAQYAAAAEMIAVVLAGILLFVIVFLLKMRVSIKATVLGSTPLVAVVCLGVPFLGSFFQYLFLGLSTTCFTLGLLLLQVVSSDYGEGNLRVSVGAYSVFAGLVCCITILGYYLPIERLASTLDVPTAVVATLVCVVVLILGLSIERISLFRGRDGDIDESDPISAAVDDIVLECGLTAKEAEVLLLMANGRDIPSIAKQLVVSQSTVRTHNKHLFQKMGVHSRQECIDEVMRYRAR